jgi:anti-sigma-K factor RskA
VPWLLLAATILLTFTSAYLVWRNYRLEKRVNDLGQQLREKESEVGTFVAPTTKVIALLPNKDLPSANARLFWDTNRNEWAIYIYDLPKPPSGKEYQLWYVPKKSKPVSAAVFTTDEQGYTVLRLPLRPDVIEGLGATAVTLEPQGGSPQPTSNILLQAGI